MVRKYLLAQSSKSMMTCLSGDYIVLATELASQDRLGWDCFIEGRIWKVFLVLEVVSPEKWCCIFIEKLLLLTHKQWLHVHYKKLTTAQHEESFNQVRTLVWTDPGELLAKHR